jgi:hypothetical protein
MSGVARSVIRNHPPIHHVAAILPAAAANSKIRFLTRGHPETNLHDIDAVSWKQTASFRTEKWQSPTTPPDKLN